MVTSYYIMKMNNKKIISMEEYYSGLHDAPLPAINEHVYRSCRVCLQDGDILITNEANYIEMTETLNIFGNIEIDHEDPTYLCNACHKFLKSAILFRKVAHRTNETLRQSPYKLSSDYRHYDPSRTFEDDQISEFENENFPTEYLDYDKESEKDKKVQCPVCNELLSESSFKLHLQLNHPVHNKEQALPDHLRDHGYLGTFNETFPGIKSNQIHSTEKPKGVCIKVQCPICKKHFRKSSYKVHLQLHNRKTEQKKKRKGQVESKTENQDQWPICPICKKVFTPNYYKKHLEIHNSDNTNQYICDICGKTFKVKNNYFWHRFRHKTGVFKCKLCPYYASPYKNYLERHMRLHTGPSKYLCSHCPARYKFAESLTCHIRMKHTQPQYKCDTCDRAFYSTLNLQRHIDAAHLGIKNHECEICGATFGYRKYLLRHQRHVHNCAQLKQIYSRSIYDSILKNNNN